MYFILLFSGYSAIHQDWDVILGEFAKIEEEYNRLEQMATSYAENCMHSLFLIYQIAVCYVFLSPIFQSYITCADY